MRFVETLHADEVNLHNPMQFLGQSRKERFGIAVFADFMRYDWSRNRYSVSVGWISTDKRLVVAHSRGATLPSFSWVGIS